MEKNNTVRCGRCGIYQVVYEKKYSGEKLCSKCFSNSIVRKTAKTISKYKMIKNNDVVCVGVSGGKDSLSLLEILNTMSHSHNFKIKAVTIDEGIPGYREEALEIAENYCRKLGIDHNIFSYKEFFDVTLEEKLLHDDEEKSSSCSICGTLRRRALDQAAERVNANVIATGHNLDDNIQTFLINLMSGDITKIGWMDPDTTTQKLRRIKPFCEIYEQEIVFYAFTNKIPFQAEPCPHMDEGIRTPIREFFNNLETKRSGIKNNFYKSSVKISQEIKKFNNKKKRGCQICGKECTGVVCSVCRTIKN